jgi:hypothetical protein
MPTLLADLINAIPVAGRRDVISPESHNSVRDAIVAIVTELGGAVATRNVTLTFAPTFLEVPDPSTPGRLLPKWRINIGFAQSSGAASTVGWLPLQLPDRSQIQQLSVVFGGRGRLASAMRVQLQRQFIPRDIFPETLAMVAVGSVELDSVKIENAPFAERPPADIVNNDEYKYFVRADLGEIPSDAHVNIFAIRVGCRLGSVGKSAAG